MRGLEHTEVIVGDARSTTPQTLRVGDHTLTAPRIFLNERPKPTCARAAALETQGFMKVVVDAERRRLLGAAILGYNGDEVIHALLDMMTTGSPVDAIARTMHIHPTVSELVPTLLKQLKPMR